jgi:coenzyme F420-reducing hydrogenase delta subunit
MVNVSAAMGAQFAQNAKEFSEQIYEIGPNPIKTVEEETAI